MIRRVKKTTNEQFDLLKAEMATHPAAARGYGVGNQRVIVDAEWKEIVEKLNAIGPPERTMTEWKKVWSDLRLRSIKRLSEEFTPKPKKVKYKSKKNKLLETLNSSESIYASLGSSAAGESEYNGQQKTYLSPPYIHNESLNELSESYENNPLEDEQTNVHKTEIEFYNSSHDTNQSYIFNQQEEQHNNTDNDGDDDNDDQPPPLDSVHAQLREEKYHNFSQSLINIEEQVKNQNKLMEHLTKITSNLAKIMENHVVNLEKQNSIMERQLKATECHNLFLRRQEARRKLRNKCNINKVQKS